MLAVGSAADTAKAEAWFALLRPLCLARLQESHDPATALFARQLRDASWGDTVGTEAVTSTAACLIALSRLGADFAALGIDRRRSLAGLGAAVRQHRYSGALGIAVWANAVNSGADLTRFLHLCGASQEALRPLMDRLTTMELAWLLSGLLHERQRVSSAVLERLSGDATRLLLSRQRPSGLFVHADKAMPLPHRLRRHVATFADQIYAIQALAFAALGAGGRAPLAAACRCADAILGHRGPRQQWWWHYNPGDGSVLRHYPVYSVHQYGMAPMAFLALAAAGAEDYRHRAWPGLDWLAENELQRPMLDSGAGTVWRDIEIDRSWISKRLGDAAELIGLGGGGGERPSWLRLNRETRPYEWAWCLMADAQLTSRPAPPHLA